MNKDKFLTIRLSSDILDALDALSQKKGVPRATVARNILAKGIDVYDFLEEAQAQRKTQNLSQQITPAMTAMIVEILTTTAERLAREIADRG